MYSKCSDGRYIYDSSIYEHFYYSFISYGGSRIVCDLALMGFFLGIYRRKDILPYELLKNKKECQGEEVKSRKYNNIILGWALNIIRTSEDIEEVNITFKQK